MIGKNKLSKPKIRIISKKVNNKLIKLNLNRANLSEKIQKIIKVEIK